VLLQPQLTDWHQVAAMKPGHHALVPSGARSSQLYVLATSSAPRWAHFCHHASVLPPKIRGCLLDPLPAEPSVVRHLDIQSSRLGTAIMARVSSYHIRPVGRAPGAAPAAPALSEAAFCALRASCSGNLRCGKPRFNNLEAVAYELLEHLRIPLFICLLCFVRCLSRRVDDNDWQVDRKVILFE